MLLVATGNSDYNNRDRRKEGGYRGDVRRMLPLWGKTEAEFIRDVDAMIQRLEDVE